MDVSATSADPIGRLVYFTLEREKVRIAKEAGAAKPWTLDPILQANRFCNIRREESRRRSWHGLARTPTSRICGSPRRWRG
jgi:alpha-glutamyl/putrescinyl thymine pyrophosphorylase clade 1